MLHVRYARTKVQGSLLVVSPGQHYCNMTGCGLRQLMGARALGAAPALQGRLSGL